MTIITYIINVRGNKNMKNLSIPTKPIPISSNQPNNKTQKTTLTGTLENEQKGG